VRGAPSSVISANSTAEKQRTLKEIRKAIFGSRTLRGSPTPLEFVPRELPDSGYETSLSIANRLAAFETELDGKNPDRIFIWKENSASAAAPLAVRYYDFVSYPPNHSMFMWLTMNNLKHRLKQGVSFALLSALGVYAGTQMEPSGANYLMLGTGYLLSLATSWRWLALPAGQRRVLELQRQKFEAVDHVFFNLHANIIRHPEPAHSYLGLNFWNDTRLDLITVWDPRKRGKEKLTIYVLGIDGPQPYPTSVAVDPATSVQ
jgi:hypothetical protein